MEKISLTCFSDVLCIWAYIAQARIDEVERQYGQQVSVDYRFCSVFADTRHKMATVWKHRGGYERFADHPQDVGNQFDHISLHPEIWRECRPLSSTPAHMTLKAVQLISDEHSEQLLIIFDGHFSSGRWISVIWISWSN